MTNVEPKTLKLEKEFIRCPEHFNTLDCDLKIFQDCRLWSRLTWRLPAPAAAAVSAAFAFSAFALPIIPPMKPPAPSAGASPFSPPWGLEVQMLEVLEISWNLQNRRSWWIMKQNQRESSVWAFCCQGLSSSYLVMEERAEKVKRSNYPVMLAHKHHFADWSVIKFGHF